MSKKLPECLLKKNIKKDIKQMRNDYVGKWVELSLYLDKEMSEGKREFRIAFQGEKHFIVHPLGKDGNTLDMDIE
jgi:hypothetical protein